MSTSTTRPVDRRATWVQAAIGSGAFVALLWVVEAIDAATGDALNQYGVQPRDGEGLLGIIWSPLLHLNFAHLSANSVPALVLLFLTLLSGIARGLLTTAIVWVVGGLGVWLFSPSDTVTIGASGLVFGWLVYLMVRGFVSHRAGEIVLGIVLLLVYGGILLGVLPGQPGVSWQGHLFGSVGGLLAAWWTSAPRRRTRRR
jgi:membrane associated rhomboid family serine protease